MHPGKPIHRIEAGDAAVWILVCAALPALFAVVTTAFNATVNPRSTHAQLVIDGLIAAVVLIPLLCGCLQWYALRRFARHLRLWSWLLAGVVSLAIALGSSYWMLFSEQVFETAVMRWRMHDSMDAAATVQLCAGLILVVTVSGAIAAAKSLLQSWMLGSVTGISWRLFLVAAVAGAVAATTVEQLANFAGLYRPSTLNGLGWTARFVELSVRACFGAIYGTASGYVLMKLLPRDADVPAMDHTAQRRLGTVFLAAGLSALCIPASIAVMGRDGGRSALAALSKAFTLAPAADESRGENVLSFAHAIAAVPGKYPVVRFSPDSRMFIVMDAERRLMLVDVATGRTLGQLAEALALHESYDIAWNSDGSLLALRTRGTEERIPNTVYSRYRPRIRTYSMPGRTLLREHEPTGDECYESHASVSLIFAPDDRSLWTLCDQYSQPRAEDIMAVQMDATSLQPLAIKRYGPEHVANAPRTLGVSAGQVMYLQHRNFKDVEEIRFGRLDIDEPVLRIENLGGAGLADGLTLQEDVIEPDHIVADYCGAPASAPARSICRAIRLDAATGAVENVTDDIDRRFAGPRSTLTTRAGLRVEAGWHADSKHGEITVRNGPAGAIRQHIDTYEQRPLTFSPDARWLVTHAPGRRTLNVYRVAP